MFTPLTISGLIIGLVLILGGSVLLVLTYTTKMFYTTTKIAAGASIADGRTIVGNADVAWDDTGIVLDSTGNFLKWTSTKLYTDISGGASYSYDLIKADSTGAITTKTSNTGLKGLSLNGTAPLMNNRGLTTQTWASFPRYQNDMTIIYAFSCPSTKGATKPSGMSFWDHADNFNITDGGQLYDTYIDTSVSSYNQVNPIAVDYYSTPFSNVKTYTSTDGTLTNNISAFSYTASTSITTIDAYSTYYNGVRVPFKLNGANGFSRPRLNFAATQPKIEIGRFNGGVAYIGTIHAAYVFSRVLSADEVSSVSSFLQQKYFAPQLIYPSTFNVVIGVTMPNPIRNTLIPGAAPITYSISPSLPLGLYFNPTNGDISGTPSQATSPNPYTITGTNAITSSTTTISILSLQSSSNPIVDANVTMTPPNISLTVNAVSAGIGTPVSSPIPANTGGNISTFAIQPSINDPGLKFDIPTGVISGKPTLNTDTLYTITAVNSGGSASTTFRLTVGTTVVYTGSVHCKIGDTITPIIPIVKSADGAGVSITKYTCTGDLHGLKFDQATGIISGTPNEVGINTVTITAFIDSTTFENKVPITIVDSKELKNKNTYVAIGGASVGAGAVFVAASCHFGF